MKELDINLLIEKTQDFINDDKINSARWGEQIVQTISINQKTYHLIIKLEFVANEN